MLFFRGLMVMKFLQNLGKVKRSVAEAIAIEEYEAFRVVQDREYISDFDKLVAYKRKTDEPN